MYWAYAQKYQFQVSTLGHYKLSNKHFSTKQIFTQQDNLGSYLEHQLTQAKTK